MKHDLQNWRETEAQFTACDGVQMRTSKPTAVYVNLPSGQEVLAGYGTEHNYRFSGDVMISVPEKGVRVFRYFLGNRAYETENEIYTNPIQPLTGISAELHDIKMSYKRELQQMRREMEEKLNQRLGKELDLSALPPLTEEEAKKAQEQEKKHVSEDDAGKPDEDVQGDKDA